MVEGYQGTGVDTNDQSGAGGGGEAEGAGSCDNLPTHALSAEAGTTTGEARDRILSRALGAARGLWAELDPDGGPGRRSLEHACRFVADPPVLNASGQPVLPVLDVGRDAHYEVVLMRSGELAFRLEGHHDWFNLLSWRVWPRAKAALNFRHNLHYLAVLRARHPDRWRERVGERVPRDGWMQTLAMLDEGGCVVSEALVARYAQIDPHQTWIWHSIPQIDALDAGFRWFGHAALESVVLGRPAPPLRMWTTVLPELDDEALARRILTFDLELEGGIGPVMEEFAGVGREAGGAGAGGSGREAGSDAACFPAVLPWYRDAVRFGEGDPFKKPCLSIYSPWEGHVGDRRR